jgi:cellulose synthase/poly-beta-1,6-N-acetylglucosamine synthase-like glycosyltransferase
VPAANVFWCAAAVAAYVYAGYPLVLVAMRPFLGRPVRKAPFLPSVSLLITAYNEAAVIEQKVRNSLDLDYPADRLEIVVASDGSSDQTADLVRPFADGERLRLIAFPKNRGKIAAMNDAVRELKGEIVVFSDASSMLQPGSIRALAANFFDPAVGAVSGVYQLAGTGNTSIGGSEQLYWKYETFLKTQEAAMDSLLGGHGHLHAIRRPLYPFPPLDTINDDYVISVSVVASGYRAVYEPEAIGYEEAAEMAGFQRRVRIMAGNVQQLREIPRLLKPPRILPLFFFISHKVGRLAVPFCMLAMLLSNLLLLSSPLYRVTAALQGTFYLLSALGAKWRLKPKVLRVPWYFSMINAATFFGIYFALRGRRRLVWK